MHKIRRFVPPIPSLAPGSYDLYSPRVRLAALPLGSLHVTGDFEALTKPILDAAARNARRALDIPHGHIIVPVHELQVPHILDKFKEAIIYEEQFSVPALAQQSIRYGLASAPLLSSAQYSLFSSRSILPPEILPTTQLKLAVGIKLTSAVRTISPASMYLGPRFSAQVVPALHFDRSLLTVVRELASVGHVEPCGEIAKPCGRLCASVMRMAYIYDLYFGEAD